jgi:hypothetical protein
VFYHIIQLTTFKHRKSAEFSMLQLLPIESLQVLQLYICKKPHIYPHDWICVDATLQENILFTAAFNHLPSSDSQELFENSLGAKLHSI